MPKEYRPRTSQPGRPPVLLPSRQTRSRGLITRRTARHSIGRITVKTLKWLAAGLCVLLAPSLASAQNFPDHTIRLIVPFPPGGPNDIIARVVAQKMQESLKQTIIIDNRGGQGGVLGTDLVAKARPDGYTIAVASAGALAISPSMEKVAYETLKDLAPVTLVAKVPEMLVVAENVPAKNMAELIALAKKQPGKLNFASSGPGSLPQLQTENWYGMVAPAGTPKDVVAALNKAAGEAMKDPDVMSKLSSQGAILVGDTPDEFRAFIASETAK